MAERVEAAIDQRLADRVVNAEGLAVGDRVVIEGLVELSGGEPITSLEYWLAEPADNSRAERGQVDAFMKARPSSIVGRLDWT